MTAALYPLITRDPASGGELIVTRLESPASGVVIDGRFSLGWMGRLTPDQLDFVGLLLKYRTNVQKLATELGIAYNTARGRLDDIVAALGGIPDAEPEPAADPSARSDALDRLEAGEIGFDEAMDLLRRPRRKG